MSPSDEREKILPCKGGLGDVATMSSWGSCLRRELNGMLWNVMGPARNRDGKEDGRVGMDHGKNRKARRRLVTVTVHSREVALHCLSFQDLVGNRTELQNPRQGTDGDHRLPARSVTAPVGSGTRL